ncbi:hypothetical protein EYV94_23195 [Puteibacter caeruleilacunae]|nr:hypothetical protein EYV94_23195 [Puteibacter caeruleilacunae]
MKKYFLLALMFICTLNLSAQIKKGDFLINADGRYTKTRSTSGVAFNSSGLIEQNLEVGGAIKYFLSNGFLIGIGLEYNKLKQEKSSFLASEKFYMREQMDLKSKVLMPKLYFGYFHNIIDRLYINGTLQVGYGKKKTDATGVIQSADSMFSSSMRIDPYEMEFDDFDYFKSKLAPGITYFITERWSVGLDLGGIEYDNTDWDSDRIHWTVSFDPKYWTFSVGMRL